jgi:hypothetical protein
LQGTFQGTSLQECACICDYYIPILLTECSSMKKNEIILLPSFSNNDENRYIQKTTHSQNISTSFFFLYIRLVIFTVLLFKKYMQGSEDVPWNVLQECACNCGYYIPILLTECSSMGKNKIIYCPTFFQQCMRTDTYKSHFFFSFKCRGEYRCNTFFSFEKLGEVKREKMRIGPPSRGRHQEILLRNGPPAEVWGLAKLKSAFARTLRADTILRFGPKVAQNEGWWR